MWDPAATVLVHSGASTAPAVQGPPDVRYFAGSLAGAPGSTVMLSVDPAGGVTGMAAHGKERWALHRPALSPQAAAAGVAPAGLSSRKAARSGGATAGRQPFHCGASGLEAERPPQAQQPQQAQAVAAQQAGGQGGAARKLLQVSCCCCCWENASSCCCTHLKRAPDLLCSPEELARAQPLFVCPFGPGRLLRRLHRWRWRQTGSCTSAWAAPPPSKTTWAS